MIPIIKKDFDEFEQYHRNIFNISFHIFCGFIFLSFLFLLFKKHHLKALAIYALILIYTMKDKPLIIMSVLVGLYILTDVVLKDYKFKLYQLFGLFLFFYFLPDLSHYLTNEKTVLKLENITFFNLFTNIFYLLPFSLMCLVNKF